MFYPDRKLLLCGGGGDGGAGAMRAQQLQQQADVTAATDQINAAFAGFNPDWYTKQQQNFENQQMPQVQQQFQQAADQGKQQMFSQGLGNSSVNNKMQEALQTDLGTAEQGVANDALNATNSLKQNVAQQQQSLVGQANAANVPSSVAQSAIGAAGQFATPSMIAPVGQLFSSFANTYLAGKQNQAYNPTGTSMQQTYNPALQGLSAYASGAFNPVSYTTR